ncbi:hypothetical protein BDA99DRAFT_562530 [Phascolomyces articulosus]|uniref:OTU domain-containing protein n=1 Tax=Phascolomyces articulosus TaxID=60185 RepID=A0AAD5K500_9FUNG|nr:hypothetical protein BDA99DRAFT_562530 [Phascolomyces articulosus]
MSFKDFPDGDIREEINLVLKKGENGGVKFMTCNTWIRPKSSQKRIDQQIVQNCATCNTSSLEHVGCDCRITIYIRGSKGDLVHRGTHTHGRFVPLHFTMKTLDEVEQRILEFPQEKPQALKIGTSHSRVQMPARPMNLIDENLQNLGTIKRLQRNYLIKNDKLPSAQPAFERAHMELADLTMEFPGYLQDANIMPGQMCFTFCAPGIAGNADFKKHPMLTDTFDFVFGLNGDTIDMNFSGLVMDFSQAQREGFLMAYREAFPYINISPESLLKGCYHHFKQSVQRIISNHAIVPAGSDVDFRDLTNAMYNAESEKAYDRTVRNIRDDYPNAKKWLDWWTRDEIAGMIFKYLYRIVQRKKPMIETLYQIFTYLRSSEKDLEFVGRGGRADYNRKKTSKPRKITEFVNDGRAPDTTKTLLDLEERRRRAEKHAERIKENKRKLKQDMSEEDRKKRRLCNDGPDRWRMNSIQLFSHLKLSTVSTELLMKCGLYSDDVHGIYNPRSDGNCGWRAASAILNGDEDHYQVVKMCMLETMRNEKDLFIHLFTRGEYHRIIEMLDQPTGPVSFENWFEVIDCPRILAHTYNQPVVLYSINGSEVGGTTFLPFKKPECGSDGYMIDVSPIILVLQVDNGTQTIINDVFFVDCYALALEFEAAAKEKFAKAEEYNGLANSYQAEEQYPQHPEGHQVKEHQEQESNPMDHDASVKNKKCDNVAIATPETGEDVNINMLLERLFLLRDNNEAQCFSEPDTRKVLIDTALEAVSSTKRGDVPEIDNLIISLMDPTVSDGDFEYLFNEIMGICAGPQFNISKETFTLPPRLYHNSEPFEKRSVTSDNNNNNNNVDHGYDSRSSSTNPKDDDSDDMDDDHHKAKPKPIPTPAQAEETSVKHRKVG